MLPGLRFLFAAIVLSMSVLVFGLGAAALLRAAHEEFVSSPAWRAVPETMFAQPSAPDKPVLALLQAEPPAPFQPKSADRVPAAEAEEPAQVAAAPVAPELAPAATPADISAAPRARPEGSAPDLPAASQSPAKAEDPAAATTPIAATFPALPANNAAEPAATEPAGPSERPEKSAAPENSEPIAAADAVSTAAPLEPAAAPPAAAGSEAAADIAVPKFATLGDAPVASRHPQTESQSKSERLRRVAAAKRLQARAATRHKVAQHARTADVAATAAFDPFKGPYLTPSGH